MVSTPPPVRVVEMVDVPLEPCWTETLVGLALIEKSFGAAVTVRVTVVACVALVPVPVTVTVYVPGGVVPAVVIVIVELLPAVTAVGLNDAVAPAGRPLALRLTFCAEPLVTAVEIVDDPLEPCWTETLVGLALIEKSLAGAAGQPGSLNVPIRVRQLNAPFAGMYSFTYQNVHPSEGSMLIEL
jgi:hypothetical protein